MENMGGALPKHPFNEIPDNRVPVKTYEKRPTMDSKTYYFIVSQADPSKCLTIRGGGHRGQELIWYQPKKQNNNNQLWTLSKDDQLVSKTSPKLAADIVNEDKNPGAPVIGWTPHRGANQKWKLRHDGALVSVMNNLVMEVDDSGRIKMARSNCTATQRWNCVQERDYKWSSEEEQRENEKYFYIISDANQNRCLEIVAAHAGFRLIWFPPSKGNGHQLWKFDEKGQIVSKTHQTLVADIILANKSEGAGLVGWHPHGGINQSWTFHDGQILSNMNGLAMEANKDGYVTMSHPKNTPRCTWHAVPEDKFVDVEEEPQTTTNGEQRFTNQQYFFIVSQADKTRCLSIGYNGEWHPLACQPHKKHNPDTQLWRMDDRGHIVSKTCLVADVVLANRSPGAEVCGYTSHEGDNQKWSVDAGQIVSEMNGLVMEVDAGSDKIKMAQPEASSSTSAAAQKQKWEFVPYVVVSRASSGGGAQASATTPPTPVPANTFLPWDSRSDGDTSDENNSLSKSNDLAGSSEPPRGNHNLTLSEHKLCKICMEQEASMAFLPCGHLVCCTICAPAHQCCPICRAGVKDTVRIYTT